MTGDTIAAIATPPGRGGIGIVRLSGPAAKGIAEGICRQPLAPRQAAFAGFYVGEDKQGRGKGDKEMREGARNRSPLEGEQAKQGQRPQLNGWGENARGGDTEQPIDRGLALYFQKPASFTGEDVAELHGHGSPALLDMLLRACCQAGARLARPGEFSERAFLNGKIDLAQAEAIADLINAATEAAARGAARSLQGAFSKEVASLVDKITSLRVYVEAAIDFPEEEVDFISSGDVSARLNSILARADDVLSHARQGRVLLEGIKLVIAGPPNAGKSSLLNALCGRDAAIVTPIAGTTRDVLREPVELDGIPLHLADTAGLRESGDAIEEEGIRRAWKEIEHADRILWVRDAHANPSLAITHAFPESTPITIIRNKCDLLNEPAAQGEHQGRAVITLSAKTGEGIPLLKRHLKQTTGIEDEQPAFAARRRHIEALTQTRECLLAGQRQLKQHNAAELLAEDLRQAHRHLGEITGAVSSDELLGKIFSEFCIGK